MTSKSVLAAGLLAVALCAAAPVSAKTVQITYKGVVKANSTNDILDLFGGGDIIGQPFTAVYTIIPSRGSEFTDGSTYSAWFNNGAPPGISEALTIDGHTFTFTSVVAGPTETYRLHGFVNPALNTIFKLGPGPIFGILSAITNGSPELLGSNYIMSTDTITPSYDFTSPWTYTAGASDSVEGYFDDGREGLILDTESVSVADVPEPAAWALMLGGFGAIGSALRARRRAHPV